MPDASAYCAELVRAADRDRYLATLFAPESDRAALFALYAFNVEVARVREAAREALPGEIRLQWWREVVGGERHDEAAANPVAAALLATIERHGLAPETLIDLIDAHRFDLYDAPMARVADLEAYATKTASAVIALAAQILGAGRDEPAAEPAGIACGIAGLLQALPRHAARGQVFLPAEFLDRHQVSVADILAGRSSAGLKAVCAALRQVARGHLAAAASPIKSLPAGTLPAFLPVALVRTTLDRQEPGDPFAPADIAPWRRQWLIWRAARNPSRIAG